VRGSPSPALKLSSFSAWISTDGPAGFIESKLVGLIGRLFLSAAATETSPSLLWFATIQGIECKHDLTGRAPKDCFILAQAVERVTGQIGKTQKSNVQGGWRDQRILALSWAGLAFRL
jgi:hypothetical protein